MVLELNLCGLRIFDLAPHASDSLHGHGNCYQISIPLKGNPSLQCNQEIRRVNETERLLVSPNDQHRHMAHDDPAKIMIVGFREEYITQVLEEHWGIAAHQGELIQWGKGNNEEFRKLAQQAFLQGMEESSDLLQLEEIECELVKQLLSTHQGTQRRSSSGSISTSRPTYHPAIRRAVELIQTEFTSELSLDQVALASGVTKYHLIQLFHKHLRTTPSQYITEVRLDRATRLGQNPALDITSVAFEAGFGSLRAFQRSFKKKYGTSFREYRRHL